MRVSSSIQAAHSLSYPWFKITFFALLLLLRFFDFINTLCNIIYFILFNIYYLFILNLYYNIYNCNTLSSVTNINFSLSLNIFHQNVRGLKTKLINFRCTILFFLMASLFLQKLSCLLAQTMRNLVLQASNSIDLIKILKIVFTHVVKKSSLLLICYLNRFLFILLLLTLKNYLKFYR